MNIEQPNVGIFLISILQNFGLTFDEDKTTADKLVLSSLSHDGYTLAPCVEIIKLDQAGTKSFRCGDELMFNYDSEHIYLPQRISSHDLICELMRLCGWTVTDISAEILSDHDNGKISETRISYCNKILLGITIKDKKIALYTEHKHVGAAEYEIVVID